MKRLVDLVVLSDVHLGTYGCRARELSNYLKSIQPKELVLNGDIIDIWQFNKRYFPKDHMKVIKAITSLLSKVARYSQSIVYRAAHFCNILGKSYYLFCISVLIVIPCIEHNIFSIL